MITHYCNWFFKTDRGVQIKTLHWSQSSKSLSSGNQSDKTSILISVCLSAKKKVKALALLDSCWYFFTLLVVYLESSVKMVS